MLAFDHVIVLTPNVEASARALREVHGLATAPGGRHPGHGTANLIVPLGPDYLELMYVADRDEAAGSPLGRWVLDGVDRGAHVAALILRVEDVTPYARRLGLPITEIHRTRPDGVELSWRLAGLEVAVSDDPRPAFIECHMAAEHHPGRDPATHDVQPLGIAWAEFGGDPSILAEWLGDHTLDLRPVPARAGPVRVGIGTDGGEIVLT